MVPKLVKVVSKLVKVVKVVSRLVKRLAKSLVPSRCLRWGLYAGS